MREIKISSVSEYVKHIEKISPLADYWYRGVAKKSYLPLPKIYWKNAMKHESALEHFFLVSYKSYIENTNLTAWEIFALMQHHGLPTRLLDWSESALIALYFALTSEPSSTAYRAVWVLNPYELNKSSIGTATLYCPAILNNRNIDIDGKSTNIDSYLPPNLSPPSCNTLPDTPLAIHSTQHLKRVSSQKGCFTIHGEKKNSIDTYLTDADDFHMIKVDARTKKSRNKMLDVLASMGVDEEFIFQDLDSLCSKIKREYKI